MVSTTSPLIRSFVFAIVFGALFGVARFVRAGDYMPQHNMDMPAGNALSSGFGATPHESKQAREESYKNIFNRDYYNFDPKVHTLVKTVEAYHLNQGIGKLEAGHYKFAMDDFKFMLHHYPNHPRALELAGRTALLMGNEKEGEGFFKRAIRMFPNSPRAGRAITYKEYGKFLYEAKKYDRAIAALNHSLALDDISSEANYYLGLAYFAKKDYTHANEHAQRAYAEGFPLTQLREKLTAVNAWKPLGKAAQEADTR